MKTGCFLINTARGGIIETNALLHALESGRLGAACLDVYEREKPIFLQNLRQRIITDQTFIRLQSLPNVFLTGHQGFLTQEALSGIAAITMQNLDYWERGLESPNSLP
jgi:D-lactate dehydrogenase